VTASGWFAARPSGTENIYKIYAESFQSDGSLNAIVSEAQEIVDGALNSPEARAMNAPRNTGPLPFPPDYRASGLLLHVTSLPSRYGIGDVGPAAVAWIDRLRAAGQSWWQALPLGPTCYDNSPYQPLSSFAGNELLVSRIGW